MQNYTVDKELTIKKFTHLDLLVCHLIRYIQFGLFFQLHVEVDLQEPVVLLPVLIILTAMILMQTVPGL